MKTPCNVAVLVGSLRKDSWNRKIAEALVERAGPGLECRFVEIGDLPHYNEDLDTDAPPDSWTRLRADIAASDAILFVTPEYNRSVPSALKNALDVGSRPYGKSVWDGKSAAVVTASPGATGGFGSNHALRQSLVFLNVPAMQQPEVYIGQVNTLFDDSGELVAKTGAFLDAFMAAYREWIARFVG